MIFFYYFGQRAYQKVIKGSVNEVAANPSVGCKNKDKKQKFNVSFCILRDKEIQSKIRTDI